MRPGFAPQRRALARIALRAVKPLLGPGMPVSVQRATLEALGRATPRVAADATRTRLAGIPALRVTAPGTATERAILYLHGGGYVIGSSRAYRNLAARLATSAGAEAIVLDYRRAPEHPFPFARDDALAAWRALCAKSHGQRFIVGDSAGGGLALATALAIRDSGLPLPDGIVLLSPWLDLTLSGLSLAEQAASDPVLSAAALERWARLYAGGTDRRDAGLSPLFADHAGLPSIHVQVGSDEVLLSDAQRLADTSSADVRLERYDGLWHVFQFTAGIVPDADRAIARIGEFIRREPAPSPPAS